MKIEKTISGPNPGVENAKRGIGYADGKKSQRKLAPLGQINGGMKRSSKLKIYAARQQPTYCEAI